MIESRRYGDSGGTLPCAGCHSYAKPISLVRRFMNTVYADSYFEKTTPSRAWLRTEARVRQAVWEMRQKPPEKAAAAKIGRPTC